MTVTERSDVAVSLITGLEVIVDRASEVLSSKDIDPTLRGQVAHIRTGLARQWGELDTDASSAT